ALVVRTRGERCARQYNGKRANILAHQRHSGFGMRRPFGPRLYGGSQLGGFAERTALTTGRTAAVAFFAVTVSAGGGATLSGGAGVVSATAATDDTLDGAAGAGATGTRVRVTAAQTPVATTSTASAPPATKKRARDSSFFAFFARAALPSA